MSEKMTEKYADKLSQMIRCETISSFHMEDVEKFRAFHMLLRSLFPNIFSACEFEDHGGSFFMRWKGSGGGKPLLLMNHHDVVEAPGEWKYGAFSGEIAEGKLWGRGALDTKGGLFAMLQAADELAAEGFVPQRDIYFESACTEECDGSGAEEIARIFEERKISFFMSLDEGGMIMYDPIGGADGTFAMIGMGEKGCADIRFTAKSNGGHASTPGKNTPMVRLGKFMAAAEKAKIFPSKLQPVTCEMFSRLSRVMHGPLRFVLAHAGAFRPLLCRVMPMVSDTAGAMLKTTVAFTMAGGSDGTNVLPREAWVVGNMRYSHHQGGKASIEAIKKLAEKFDVETEVMDPGLDSSVSSYDSDAFRLIEKAVNEIFPGVITAPYVMTGASDSRYMDKVSESCIRFAPFLIDDQQLESIHGVNENISLSALAPAVDFYRYIIKEV